jgi:hypothetical protein
MSIWFKGLGERKAKMREKMPDSKQDDQEKVNQHMETLEGNYFNQEDYEFVEVEEITDESNSNWETFGDKEKHFEITEGDIENLETVHGSWALTRNLQDLPDELILQVLSYSEPKDLISSGQVSKRLRSISYDNSLWQRVNLSKKIVKTKLLELILNKGCKSLNLCYSKILPSELIFKVLSYSESRDLVYSGQVSKRLITISWDIISQFWGLVLRVPSNESAAVGVV